MKRIPLVVIMRVAIVSIPMFAIAALAQQSTAQPRSATQDSLPTVEEQLKVLNEKLDLTAVQQAKVKPILQHLHDATQNVIEDQNLSRDERLAKVRPERQAADKKIREILS